MCIMDDVGGKPEAENIVLIGQPEGEILALSEQPQDKDVSLTRREMQVLSLVYEGYSSQEIAKRLYVSKRTVDFHLGNIYVKLNVTNRVQAFLRATRLGLFPVDAMSHRA